MVSNTKNIIRNKIIFHIIMSQVESDYAKGIITSALPCSGYSAKDSHINKAIALINKNKLCGVKYSTQIAPDQNGHKSRIIYFEINYYGRWIQISFHNFKKLNEPNKGTFIEWDHDIGGSRKNAQKLDKKLKLGIYLRE